jgi:hypothetical protein
MTTHATRVCRLCLGVSALLAAGGIEAQSIPDSPSASQTNSPYTLPVSLRLPAVSEVNGKVGYAAGILDSQTGHNFDGSLTFPLTAHFGLQADALYSRISHEDFFGGAGHLFWRDPEIGLVGLAGGALHHDAVDTFQFGAEGDYYLGPVTIGFFAGVGSISYANPVPFLDSSPTRFVGSVSVDWYALPDLRLGASCLTAFDNNLMKGSAEYQTPVCGLALTGEVAIGDHNYDHWLLGVRYYFGASKALRDRQRQDDPPGLMPQILHGLGLYGAEFRQRGLAYLAATPGSTSVGAWGYAGIEASRLRSGTEVGAGDLPPLPPTDLTPILEEEPLVPPSQ